MEITDIQFIKSLMFMFNIQKGKENLWMFYNDTISGFNECLYDILFNMSTVNDMNRRVITVSWLADNFYGNMFLNFPLHSKFQKFYGVDLSQLFPKLNPNKSQQKISIWVRNTMELHPSPFTSLKGAL